MPWSNVIANPRFGALVTEAGQGTLWRGNSQSNRLTPWSNDPVSDPASEAIYIRDEETGTFWTPPPLPIRENDAYRCRHGQGYSVWEHNSHAIEQELTVWVPVEGTGGWRLETGDDAKREDEQSTPAANAVNSETGTRSTPVLSTEPETTIPASSLQPPASAVDAPPLRLQRLKLKNASSRRRRLMVTSYAEWVLGIEREDAQMHVTTAWDVESGTLLAHNTWNPNFGDKVAFASASPEPAHFSADRADFLGRNGTPHHPVALRRRHVADRCGAGLDPCAVLQVPVTLEPGEETEVVFLLGEADSVEEARELVARFRDPRRVNASLQSTRAWWDEFLSTLFVETPVRSVNFLLNRWLLYQNLSCRMWGRTAFYQSGGAWGFRDQLQDVMSLVYALPQLARTQLLRAARHQFEEGDVQHWWHEPGGAGVRTRISDDLLWLPLVAAHYIRVSGDAAVLDEVVPFLRAEELKEGEHEKYFVPEVSPESATLFEHCRRAIERGSTLGPHKLPLIGGGDWNDGLNRVGVEGKGESVWMAWFLGEVLNEFAPLCEARGEAKLAREYRRRAKNYAKAVEKSAWDGDWYLRGFYDDGTPLGSHENEEAKIDSLPQSWGVISGEARSDRATQALASVEEYLVEPDEGMIRLFTPAYDKTEKDPGYIKGYVPGVRENGGQYTHAAIWVTMAFARRGDGDRAVELLRLINPVEHARNEAGVEKYKVEPYVVAADVYWTPGQVGRGGWTWYTGSASWMYRVWVEEVLGFKKHGDRLLIEPTIPASWSDFRLHYRVGSTLYHITVENPRGVQRGVARVEMDGGVLEDKAIPLRDDGAEHHVRVLMGENLASAVPATAALPPSATSAPPSLPAAADNAALPASEKPAIARKSATPLPGDNRDAGA
jgi:cyclic beta-1,2-glucan synthetase